MSQWSYGQIPQTATPTALAPSYDQLLYSSSRLTTTPSTVPSQSGHCPYPFCQTHHPTVATYPPGTQRTSPLSSPNIQYNHQQPALPGSHPTDFPTFTIRPARITTLVERGTQTEIPWVSFTFFNPSDASPARDHRQERLESTPTAFTGSGSTARTIVGGAIPLTTAEPFTPSVATPAALPSIYHHQSFVSPSAPRWFVAPRFQPLRAWRPSGREPR